MTAKITKIMTTAKERCGSLKLIGPRGTWLFDLSDAPYYGKRTGIEAGNKIELTLRRVSIDGRKKRN